MICYYSKRIKEQITIKHQNKLKLDESITYYLNNFLDCVTTV